MNAPIRRRHIEAPFVCVVCGPVEHDMALEILGEVLICHCCIDRVLWLNPGPEVPCDGCSSSGLGPMPSG